MVKRFRDTIDVDVDDTSIDPSHPAPRSFRWQGRTYVVVSILGHWREDAGYWAARSLEVPQRDLWRVEASREGGPMPPRSAQARPAVARDRRATGVFELVRETGAWRLHRVWD